MQSWKELKRLLKAKKIKDAQILSEKTEILENLEAKNPEFASFRKEAQKIASAKKVLTGDIIRKPLYIAKRAIKAWDCQGLTSDQALYAKTAYSYYLLKNQSPLVISNYVKSFREVYKAWKSGLELPDMCGKVFRKIWKELGGDFDKAEGEFAKSLLGKLAPAKSLMDLVKDAFNVSDDLLLKELVENSDLETSKTETSDLEIPKTETPNLDEIDLDSMSPEEILALQNELEDFLGISADTAEHAEEHTAEYTKEDVEKEFNNLDDEIDNVIGSLSKMIDPNVLEELESEILKTENAKPENVNSELKNAKTEFENIETELEQMLGSLSDIVKSENVKTENANLELKNTDFEISKLKNANLELKNLKTEFKNLKNTNFEISRSQNVLRNLVRTTLFEGNYAKEPRIFLRERSPP